MNSTAPHDFEASSVVLMFETGRRQCADVVITDDGIQEDNETFLVILTTVEQAVNLRRQYATVTIVDSKFGLHMTIAYGHFWYISMCVMF